MGHKQFLVAIFSVFSLSCCNPKQMGVRYEHGYVKTANPDLGIFVPANVKVCCEHEYCVRVLAFDGVTHPPAGSFVVGEPLKLTIRDCKESEHGCVQQIDKDVGISTTPQEREDAASELCGTDLRGLPYTKFRDGRGSR